MDETLILPKPQEGGNNPAGVGLPEITSSPEQGVILRDGKGNELRVREREGMLTSLDANYEELTASASSVETLHGFRVYSPVEKGATRPKRHRSPEDIPGPKDKFDPGRFGEKIDVIHDDSLHSGDVHLEVDPDDPQKIVARTGGPKTHVQVTVTPGMGVNMKMLRGDGRRVRLGWTPEEAKAVFGEEVLLHTTEVARAARLSKAASKRGEPVETAAPETLDSVPDDGDVEEVPYTTASSRAEEHDETTPPDEELVEDIEDDQAHRERLFRKIGDRVKGMLPDAKRIAVLVALGASLAAGLVSDRVGGRLPNIGRGGSEPVAAGIEPDYELSGEESSTQVITVGKDGAHSIMYTEVEQEILGVDPSLKNNSAELADDTRAIMLLTEQLNQNITDWRHLHPGDEYTMFTPDVVGNVLDMLDNKPGPDAPQEIQQEWQELYDAFTGLTTVHGTHDQFDHDKFVDGSHPKVTGWIRTLNTFMENGAWL